MSTTSLQTRNLPRYSSLLSLFSLSALPLLMVVGLLIALTGCSVPTAALAPSSATTTAISEYIPAESVTGVSTHITDVSGGILGS